MISSWFKGLFFALLRSSAIAIDCLLGCFRVEDDDDDNSFATEPLPSDSIEPVVSRNRNRLYSLLPSAGKEVSPCKNKGGHVLGTLQPDIEVGEPKDEGGESEESSKFHLARNMNEDNQPEQPRTPAKLTGEWVNMSGSLLCTPCSLTSKEQSSSSSTQEDSSDRSVLMAVQFLTNQSTTSRDDLVGTTLQKSKNKFVHFECGEYGSSSFSSKSCSTSASDSESRKQSEQPSASRANNHMVAKDYPSFSSPNPTPFKLTDDMQTPGTVFMTSYQAVTRKGKNPRIRSLYVYSSINPIQTLSLPKKVLLKEEEVEEEEEDVVRRDSLEKAGDHNDESTPKSNLGISEEDALEKGQNVESRFSSQEDDKVNLQATPLVERLEKAFAWETALIS